MAMGNMRPAVWRSFCWELHILPEPASRFGSSLLPPLPFLPRFNFETLSDDGFVPPNNEDYQSNCSDGTLQMDLGIFSPLLWPGCCGIYMPDTWLWAVAAVGLCFWIAWQKVCMWFMQKVAVGQGGPAWCMSVLLGSYAT